MNPFNSSKYRLSTNYVAGTKHMKINKKDESPALTEKTAKQMSELGAVMCNTHKYYKSPSANKCPKYKGSNHFLFWTWDLSHSVTQAGVWWHDLSSLQLPPSGFKWFSSPVSASRVSGITSMCHHIWLIFVFLVETGVSPCWPGWSQIGRASCRERV